MSSNLPYRSRAVRAMVLLHEEHLRRFVHTWRLALGPSVSLPPTDDPAYASLGALGRHVLGAVREPGPGRWPRLCLAGRFRTARAGRGWMLHGRDVRGVDVSRPRNPLC